MDLKVEYITNITEEDIEDIVVTAIEGGIGYWCCLDNTNETYENAPDDEPIAITAAKIILRGNKIKLIDECDGGTEYELGLEELLAGISTWKSCGYDTYEAITLKGVDCTMIDACGADGIFQCATIGDITYG